MNLCEAVKANMGGRVYRKATGMILQFVSGEDYRHIVITHALTLEDITADDWPPVKRGSYRDRKHLF